MTLKASSLTVKHILSTLNTPLVKSLNTLQPRRSSAASGRRELSGSFLPSQPGFPSRCCSLVFAAQRGFRARQKLPHVLACSVSFVTVLHLPVWYKTKPSSHRFCCNFAFPWVYYSHLQAPARSAGDTERAAGCSGPRPLGPWKTSKDRKRKQPESRPCQRYLTDHPQTKQSNPANVRDQP